MAKDPGRVLIFDTTLGMVSNLPGPASISRKSWPLPSSWPGSVWM